MTTVYEKSQETEKHAERLAELSTRTGRMLNLMEKDLGELQLLGMLHDIGKIGIDDKILNKPGKLTEDEFTVIKGHPVIASDLVKKIDPGNRITPIIRHHHEHYDGSGYPDGLRGNEIPLGARVVSLADSFDAMRSDRPYRSKLSIEACLNELRNNKGSQFDPELAEIFCELIRTGSID